MPAPNTVLIAITSDTGHVQLMSFVTVEYAPDGSIRWHRGATRENIDAEIVKLMSIPTMEAQFGKVVSWRVIDRADLPVEPKSWDGNRTYRAALRDPGKGPLTHDVEHCKQLGLNHLREHRQPRLEALDKRWFRAVGQGNADDAKTIEGERQMLRDLPANCPMDDCKTADDVHKCVQETIEKSQDLGNILPIKVV
jgi:hypothetical protein